MLVVDDNDDMLYLIQAYLRPQEDEIALVGIARTGREAVALVREQQPDVVLLDLVLDRENGLDVAEQMLHLQPTMAIVLFSEHLDPPSTSRAERLGIRECVPKDEFSRLRDVVRGHCPSS